MQSLGFILLYLLKGKLPWQGINFKHVNEIVKLKDY